ncbi:MAG: response regulator [Patescibacteria group bacterium]
MNKKILLIEDEDYIREIYKEELEASGFTVDGFPTGGQGLDAFHKNTYDMVVLDIVLPDINGLHVLKAIKGNSLKKNVPVLLLTNLDQDIIVKQGLEFGAEAYLEKVANTPDTIVDKIKSILEAIEAK